MSRRANSGVSFESPVDLGSLPPPGSGRSDVYRAQTAVATMTETLKEEILRAKEEARLHESEKTRAVPKFEMPDDAIGFADEAPTRPKENVPEKSGAVRRTDLPAVMVSVAEEDAESRVTIDITPPVFPVVPPQPAPARSSFAQTIPTVTPSLPPIPRHAIWPRVLVLVVTLAALCLAAFAAQHYGASRLLP